MRSREDLFPGAEKVELFLSDLAVNGPTPVQHGKIQFDTQRRAHILNSESPPVRMAAPDPLAANSSRPAPDAHADYAGPSPEYL
jgi:hypothetical protein